jgi:hypothetical protein
MGPAFAGNVGPGGTFALEREGGRMSTFNHWGRSLTSTQKVPYYHKIAAWLGEVGAR